MEYSIADYPWKNYLEDDAQDWSRRVLSYVYSDSTLSDGTPSLRPINTDLTLDNLDDYINFQLETAIARSPPPTHFKGRLGPKHVMFDVSSNVGSLVIDKDRLGVSSQSNFSSIRANCCVFEGKWQYELMLGSKGVMQVGWATFNCKFSQEKGIGDTPDSYSYDGNRVQKWNMVTSKYGEPWLTGDIIGCTIDLDNGKSSFYRNGKWLGEAFDKIRIGPGLAYFPAVSLVLNENLVANFGALPFRYPVPGYSPLEDLPWAEKLKADKLLIWLERFLPFYNQDTDVTNKQMIPEHHGWMHLPERGKKASMLLLVTPLMQHLGPLLASPYITEACFLPFLFKLCNIEPMAFKELPQPEWVKRNQKLQALLDIMWTLMDTNEIGECLEHLVVSLLIGYRFSQSTVSFYYQNCYLLLTLGVLQHENTCLYLLQNVLFDKTKFPVFLEVKPLDNRVLEEIIPTIWYETGKDNLTEDELHRKMAYKMSYENLGKRISHLQALQLQILQQLFRTSFKGEQSCRSIFLQKFSDFLKENSGGSRIPMVHLCPLSVALAFFHHLITLLRQHLECLKGMHRSSAFISKENLFVPTEVFYNGSINYSDIHRVGGLLSHLQKLYQEDLKAAIKSRLPEAMDTSERSETRVVDKVESFNFQKAESHSARRDKDDYEVLIELLDGIIRLYVISAHRQLEKMCMVRESMQEYVLALQDVDSRLMGCETEVMPALLQAREVFTKKLNEQSRHFAWVCAVIYCRESRDDIYWILHIVLRTLDQASQSGPFFAFVPDFYVEACIKACNALRSFFTISLPVEELPGWEETLIQFGSFLAHNFANARIVNADLKDSLVQAFAAFVCHPNTLKALENMPLYTQLTMVKALLQPYENRAWAQSNWILVRLWKGCGFAFRYTIPPHLVKRLGVKARQKNEDISNNHHRPCPSPLFQKQVTDWLREHPDSASVFLSSILNQLNWAFSEFIGMLQEIQNATNRPERVFIDSRQLKICATCFDLALALLRVLEMVVHLEPELLTNWTRPSAEILLTRLCQLLCQVLNRVTSRFGCFELVVSMDIPGLETVNHFPILVAVAGILLSLVDNGTQTSRDRAVKALLVEPSFLPTSLDFLLHEEMEQDASAEGASSSTVAVAASSASKPYFSLRNYSEVSLEELEQFRQATAMLHARYKLAQQEESNCVVDEETLCTICYASPKSATFQPCGHQSCRSCISLHLLHQRDCFFCKLTIEGVLSFAGEVIHCGASATNLK